MSQGWHIGGVVRRRWWVTGFGVAVALAAALFVFFELRPDLLLRNSTANGGDTGAHVWWPWYFAHHLLPKLRLSGWSPDYYAGLPIGHFYFPVPALLVTFLDVFLPYNIAFKLVTVLGPVSLPFAAYVFARGIRAPEPAPPLFAAATLPFLFYTGYTIWGGNIPSTLAGEFSFSIALSCALVFLGLFARALDDRRGLALPAVFLAAAVMSHVIVAAFAVVSAIVLFLQRRPFRNLPVAAAIGVTGGLLTALWSLPLAARLGYSTDMGWTKETKYVAELFPAPFYWAIGLGALSVIVGVAFLRRHILGLFALTALFGLAFRFAPSGQLWNARILPFYYLYLMFLAASGAAEVLVLVRFALDPERGLASWFRTHLGDPQQLDPELDADLHSVLTRESSNGDAAAATEPLAAEPLATEPLPAEERETEREPEPAAMGGTFLPTVVTSMLVAVLLVSSMWHSHATRKFIPSWTSWNETGYEAKLAYPELKEVFDTMDKLPPGRALWETSPGVETRSINDYGTPLALELLPYFTNGRISSMEGLYFETSATTPYHFLTVAELAKRPSNPVNFEIADGGVAKGLQYHSLNDFALGVQHMQLLGVRYYMAASDDVTNSNGVVEHGAKYFADQNPNLRFITETGTPGVEPKVARWRIYEVQDAPTVAPLAYEPVVITGVSPKEWLKPAAEWFNQGTDLDRILADGGPKQWLRSRSDTAGFAARKPLPPVKVTGIRSGDDSVKFHVSRTGVPVLVKTSYFPNWKASGAKGPWRASPNLMVVVPTSSNVTLKYGRTGVDWLGIGLSGLGLVSLVLLRRWRPAPLAPRPSRLADPYDEMTADSSREGEQDPELVALA
jgi:hypothetical protein